MADSGKPSAEAYNASSVAGENTHEGAQLPELPQMDPLTLHLVSRHADGMAAERSVAENREQHAYEHTGPGTIRNHDLDDISGDVGKARLVLAELSGEAPEPPADETEILVDDGQPVPFTVAGISAGHWVPQEEYGLMRHLAACGTPEQREAAQIWLGGWGHMAEAPDA